MHDSQWSAGHMFCTPDLQQWHFFVFGKGHEGPYRNHWRGGPHVHFVNWLWPTMNLRKVWDAYVKHGEKPNSTLHIRVEPDAA
jgi:hypothetical protein